MFLAANVIVVARDERRLNWLNVEESAEQISHLLGDRTTIGICIASGPGEIVQISLPLVGVSIERKYASRACGAG